jgi:hypothetical protein
MKKLAILFTSLVIISLAIGVIGCASESGQPTTTPTPAASSSPTATPGVAPQIPPSGSFIIDFGDFNSSGDQSLLPGDSQFDLELASFDSLNGGQFAIEKTALGESKNWGFAAFNVGFWNSVIVVGLAVPVASFVASFNHTPVQQPDYSWVWSYDVTVGGGVYHAELHGKYIDSGVRWDMYISKQNEYTNFNWYYGESNLPATEGFWILKNKPTDPTDLLRIDWHRNIADSTGGTKYTNIVPGGAENGGYISAETTTQTPYNASYDIYNKGQDNHTYIEWSRTTQEGRVKDSRHFGDSQWHCWDGNHIDINCP